MTQRVYSDSYDVISPPVTTTTIFVDPAAGSDDNDGLSLETAVSSLKWAVSLAGSGARIYLLDTAEHRWAVKRPREWRSSAST